MSKKEADERNQWRYAFSRDPGTILPRAESDRRQDVHGVIVMVIFRYHLGLNIGITVVVMSVRFGVMRVVVRARTVEVKMRRLVVVCRSGNARRFVGMREAGPLEEDRRDQE